MSTRELFGEDDDEDSSSDDDGDHQEEPTREANKVSDEKLESGDAAGTEKVSDKVDDGDDDNDNDEKGRDEGSQPHPSGEAATSSPSEQPTGDAAAAVAASSSKPKPPVDDSDDDDDDDDEGETKFDDVVGVSSSTFSGDKANRGDSLGGPSSLEASGTVGMSSSSTKRPSKTDKRRLIVQEADFRPDPESVSLHVTKLPNLVGIQPEAFDPSTYSPAMEEEEFGGAVHNLIRWRYSTDGNGNDEPKRDSAGRLVRESNSRLVQWEDGSWTLHVGSEAFEVDTLDKSKTASGGFAGLNGYLYLSQKAAYRMNDKKDVDEGEGEGEEQDEPAGTVLECMGPIRSRLTARPSSLQSEAHKSLTVAVRQKTIKKARIAEFVTQEDPDKVKQERIRNRDQLEKAAGRMRAGAGSGGGGGDWSSRRSRMSRDYLEEDDDFETTNLRALKGGYGDDMYGGARDSDDDYRGAGAAADDDEDETFNRRKRPKKGDRKKAPKAIVDEKEDESEEDKFAGGDDDDADEEEEVAPVVKASRKRPNLAVLDDDDDSD